MSTMCLTADYYDSSGIEFPSTGSGHESRVVKDALLELRQQHLAQPSMWAWQQLWSRLESEVDDVNLWVSVQHFLSKLPSWIDPPDADVYSDELEVYFEWYIAPHRLVSVVVNERGDLFYSGVRETGWRRSGSDRIDRGIPEELLRAIRGVARGR